MLWPRERPAAGRLLAVEGLQRLTVFIIEDADREHVLQIL